MRAEIRRDQRAPLGRQVGIEIEADARAVAARPRFERLECRHQHPVVEGRKLRHLRLDRGQVPEAAADLREDAPPGETGLGRLADLSSRARVDRGIELDLEFCEGRHVRVAHLGDGLPLHPAEQHVPRLRLACHQPRRAADAPAREERECLELGPHAVAPVVRRIALEGIVPALGLHAEDAVVLPAPELGHAPDRRRREPARDLEDGVKALGREHG